MQYTTDYIELSKRRNGARYSIAGNGERDEPSPKDGPLGPRVPEGFEEPGLGPANRVLAREKVVPDLRLITDGAVSARKPHRSILTCRVRDNAPANLRANQTKCERSELPKIARQVQRTLHSSLEIHPGNLTTQMAIARDNDTACVFRRDRDARGFSLLH